MQGLLQQNGLRLAADPCSSHGQAAEDDLPQKLLPYKRLDGDAAAVATITDYASCNCRYSPLMTADPRRHKRAAAAAAARASRDGMFFESYYDFNVTASAESDNGISVSVGFDMGAGNMIDYNDDDKLEAQGNDVGDADVAVSYAGWTLKVDQNGIDNLFDDSQAGDMSLSGSLAGMSVAVTTDQENDTNSYKVSGTVGGIALTATGTDNDDNGGCCIKACCILRNG